MVTRTLVLRTSTASWYMKLPKGVGPSTVTRWLRSKAKLDVASLKGGAEDWHLRCEHVVAFRIEG